MPCLLQDGHLLFKPGYLIWAGIRHREPLDGHFSVPVPAIDLSHRATPNQLHDLDVLVGNTPLVNDAVAMLHMCMRQTERHTHNNNTHLRTCVYNAKLMVHLPQL